MPLIRTDVQGMVERLGMRRGVGAQTMFATASDSSERRGLGKGVEGSSTYK